ncbi:hypothetical protein DFH06DRAFT_1472446 [Mycena polygramma]|nr:hypothetical protein DFH06DRAFT_1472446 [Mycena polygramma]
MPHKPTMSLSMPEYTPELEYSLDLGAEASAPTTPQLGGDAAPPRARNWRPADHEREQQARSTAYDSDGNLKVAMRGRRAAERDCGIWCCGNGGRACTDAVLRGVVLQGAYRRPPASTGLCPACDAPCVLPPSRPRSPSPSHLASPLASDVNILDVRADSLRRPRTPPASRATSHSPSSSPSRLLTSSLRPGSVLVPSPSSAHDASEFTLLARSGIRSGEGSAGDDSASIVSTADGENTTRKPKYIRPGTDALVRLLSVLAALVLLLGAMSRRGGGKAEADCF